MASGGYGYDRRDDHRRDRRRDRDDGGSRRRDRDRDRDGGSRRDRDGGSRRERRDDYGGGHGGGRNEYSGRDRRSGGNRRDNYGGGRHDDNRNTHRSSGGYGGGRRRDGGYGGGRGRGGGRFGGRGGGRGPKMVPKYLPVHGDSIIDAVKGNIGKAVLQKVNIIQYKDENETVWQEFQDYKSEDDRNLYVNSQTHESTDTKPPNLNITGYSETKLAPPEPQNLMWASNGSTENIETNCWSVLLNKDVYRYDVEDLAFDERLAYKTRHHIFPRKGSRAVRKQMQAMFGQNYIIGEGFVLSSEPSAEVREQEEVTLQYEVEGNTKTVRFRNNGRVLDENCTDAVQIEQMKQTLKFILNEIAEGAGYSRDQLSNKGSVYWKHEAGNNEIIRQRGASISAPDVTLFQTFSATLDFGFNAQTQARCLYLNVDVSFKHLSSSSLRDMMAEMKDEYGSDEDFRNAVKEKFNRTRGLVKYSSQWIQILEFDWEKDETSTFFHKRKQEDVSIADNLQDRYELEVSANAMCTVRCRSNNGFVGDYLPQHIFVTVRKEQTKAVDAQIKEREQMDNRRRLGLVKDFIKGFKDSHDGRSDITMEIGDQISCSALVIPDIELALNTGRTNEALHPKEFKQQWRNVRGFTEEYSGTTNIGILAGSSRDNEAVESKIEKYMRKRGIRDYKVTDRLTCRDYQDPEELSETLRDIQADILICVIEDAKTGSEQKSHVSRVCGKYKITTQFLRHPNINTKDTPFFGMMDDVMAKVGATWFDIKYNFQTLNPADIWVIGIDSHLSTNINSLSGCAVTLCCDITKGTLNKDWWVNRTFPLAPKESIAPLTIFREALKECMNEALTRNNPPKHILCFRGGVGESKIDILRTNEATGFSQALESVFAHDGEVPTGSYFIVPKGSRIRFGEHRKAAVICSDITLGKEFYTQVNKVNFRKVPRIIKYRLLSDEGEWFSNLVQDEPTEFLRLLHGLCYLYPQSINFSNGPCSFPGPLRMAQTKAEHVSQFILPEDQTLEDCAQLPNSFVESFTKLLDLKKSSATRMEVDDDTKSDRMEMATAI